MRLEHYPEILNVKDIQEILGIGRKQAYELIESKTFHSVRVGRSIKILKEVFLDWLYGPVKG